MRFIGCFLLWILTLCEVQTVNGQIPQGISYQAALRQPGGTLSTNAAIGVRFSMVHSMEESVVYYTEVQALQSNDYGRISAVVGGGDVVFGSFGDVPWSMGALALKVEVDFNGASEYSDVAIVPFLSVPYALHAESADSIEVLPQESDIVFAQSISASILETDTASWGAAIQPVVAGEGIEITNNTVSRRAEHYIGEFYQGGYIVALWKEGEETHGLLAAPQVLPTYPFSNITGNFIGAAAQQSNNGALSTDAIIAQSGFTNGAALACRAYGDGSWYLPSISELKALFEQRYVLEQLGVVFPQFYFWSSTEYYPSDVGSLGMAIQNLTIYSGKVTGSSKSNPSYAWPMKRF